MYNFLTYFEYPWLLVLILPLVICIFTCSEKVFAIYFPQRQQPSTKSVLKKEWTKALKFLILFSVIVALASPITRKEHILNNHKGYEISLIIDASGSMNSANKFKIVKEIVLDFISKRQGDKLALSIFADFAYVVAPLTTDKKSIKKMLSGIEVGVAGKQKTALYEAVFLSSKLFKNSQAKEKIAILLTDGVDNARSIPLEVAINNAKKNKVKFYTIGIGNFTDFNPIALKQISTQTGGKFYSANSIAGIKSVYESINKLEKSKLKLKKYTQKTYYFHYPLLFALFLLQIYFWSKRR
jgi:Ca-activated chloride channel family protein